MAGELSRDGVQVIALVNGIAASVFRVMEIHLSSGADKLDHAVVRFDLGDPAVRSYVQNMNIGQLRVTTPSGQLGLSGQPMTIVAIEGGRRRTLHWGKITVVEPDIGANEGLTLVSRLEQTHFGNPLGFQRIYDPYEQDFAVSDHEVCFNPEVKQVIVGNKRIFNRRSSGGSYPVFVDPASVETANSALYQSTVTSQLGDDGRIKETATENWNLVEAAWYLCNECNPNQTYITNPTQQELAQVLPDDRSILKNHVIRHGHYLPEALDQLLAPYGFGFRIQYVDEFTRKLLVFDNGVGTARAVQWQKPGEPLELDRQDADHVQLQLDLSMAVNQITATGSFTEVEATWELMPAWTEDLDSTQIFNLIKDGIGWDANPRYHRVGRDWVLNEDGSYTRAWRDRPASTADPQATAFFQTVYGQDHPPIVAKRRKFHPCLTLGDDQQPIGDCGGCTVEWWNPYKAGGANWDLLPNSNPQFHCRLLEHECGITFSGTLPPVLLWLQGTTARIRITATYRSDHRIVATRARPNSSLNPDVHERVLDVNTRFHARLLHPGSKYYSDVIGGRRQADTADGRAALDDFAETAREAWDQAQCSGTIRLEGLDHSEWEIGDIVTGISGRNVSFSLRGGSASEARFPQVVGITHYVQEQKTLLTINEFKETDAWVASFIRKTRRLK